MIATAAAVVELLLIALAVWLAGVVARDEYRAWQCRELTPKEPR